MENQTSKSPFYVLFVDDEEKARKYFDKALQSEFNILTAENIDIAKDIIREKSREIAVVITDQRMPGANGIRLLDFLNENYPQIIRLLTTGYSDLTEAIEAVNKGEIFRYIQKPWDFGLLKTELNQAISLFELRLEREKLISEKIVARQKMVKVERLRLLIVLSKTLNFIRFADISTSHFIRQFVVKSRPNNSNEWHMFELGNQDLLETLLAVDLAKNIYDAIPNSQNYNFDNNLNYSKIKELFQRESAAIGVNTKITISNKIPDLGINNYGFNLVVKKLLSQIIALSANSASLDIRGSEDGNDLLINLNVPNVTWPNDNIFINSPGKLKNTWHIDLLICYLLIGHHGGSVEVTMDVNENINYLIKLPFKPEAVNADRKLSDKSLDDMIFLAMLDR